jgi:RimJ/RimL family protein N-acetyltransferase
MPVVLKTLMEKFMIPYMNMHSAMGGYFSENLASKKVFEKCGFTFLNEIPDLIDVAELKCGVKGKKVGLGMMRWEKKD